MKIILVSEVSGLGRIGDVVEVRNGYAKNFLIPQAKAIYHTVNNLKIFEQKKAEYELNNKSSYEFAVQVKEFLTDKKIFVTENAADDGKLYGSVNSTTIADKLNSLLTGKKLSRSSVFLANPIKEIGVFTVKLNLHAEIDIQFDLIVTRSESEVDHVIAEHKKKLNPKATQEEVVAVEAKPAETSEEENAPVKASKRIRNKKS